MKNTLKKVFCLIMIAAMLVSIFASCSKKDNNGDKNDGDIVESTSEDPKIAKQDFGGYEFTFLTRSGNAYNINFLVSDGESGETLDDAIYRRNAILEDKYNIKIKQQTVPDLISEVRTQVLGGATEFDAILASCANLSVLARENCLYNLLDIDQFNWDASYWDTNSKEQLLIGQKLYFANCALNIHSIGFCVYFNKQLVKDYKLTSPYELMENNEWTIDNWATMVKSISLDLNKDGNMTEEDLYGSLSEHHNTRMFLYASGVRATTNDENGYPVVTLMKDKDKVVNIYEKVQDVLNDQNYSYCMDCSNVSYDGYNNKWDYLRYLFTQDHFLFHYQSNGAITQFADMESEFGVVPFPKYDKNQEKYQTIYPYNNALFALPSIIPNVERTSKIIEDMNYYSTITIVPAWYDTLLARRYARDDESEASLKLLRENCVYDLGLYYDFGGIRSKVLDANLPKINITRLFDSRKNYVEIEIQDIYKDFQIQK